MSTPSPERPDPYAVELALAAALAEVTDAQSEEIIQAWSTAWSEVAGDLQDALEVILAAGGRVNAMAIVRYERHAGVLASIADMLDDLAEELAVVVTNDLADVLGMAKAATRDLIAAQAPDIRIANWVTPPAALTAIVQRTTEQVTSTALPLADDTYAMVLAELTRGVAAGDNPRQTAERMVARAEDRTNFGMSRAVTIARTEILDAYREAARVEQNQQADILAGWMWLAHLGPKTCRACLAKHGELHGLEEPGPLGHQQCRCSRTPVVREKDGSVDTSWVPDADEHFQSLSDDEKRKILGSKGYEAWLAGDFDRAQWAERRETPGWRTSFVAAPAPGGSGGDDGGSDDGTGGDDLPPLDPWDPDDGALPVLTEENLDKIIDGAFTPRGRRVGGHGFGRGFEGKSEFPEGAPWNDREFIRSVLEQTASLAHFRHLQGTTQTARREWSSVIVEIQWYYEDAVPVFLSGFPVNGDGVGINRGGAREADDLDRVALYEYIWRHG